MKGSRTPGRGYSLVEMLVAIALTGVVVLSILTLFSLARSNVYAGRQMTHAISVGTRIMEDLSGLPLADVYSAFNITDTTALAPVTVAPASLPESTYTDSIVRSTTSLTTAGVCDLDPSTAPRSSPTTRTNTSAAGTARCRPSATSCRKGRSRWS